MLFKAILLLALLSHVRSTNFNITKSCHSVDYTQTITYQSRGCGPVQQIRIPNKRCVGVCHNVYTPEQDPMNPHPTDHCFMCKPHLSEVTIILYCNKFKKYIKIMTVLGCECTSVDCTCSSNMRFAN